MVRLAIIDKGYKNCFDTVLKVFGKKRKFSTLFLAQFCVLPLLLVTEFQSTPCRELLLQSKYRLFGTKPF